MLHGAHFQLGPGDIMAPTPFFTSLFFQRSLPPSLSFPPLDLGVPVFFSPGSVSRLTSTLSFGRPPLLDLSGSHGHPCSTSRRRRRKREEKQEQTIKESCFVPVGRKLHAEWMCLCNTFPLMILHCIVKVDICFRTDSCLL